MNSHRTTLRKQSILGSAVALLLLILPVLVQAQFNYTVENGTVTITKYTGPGGDVIIPSPSSGTGRSGFAAT
jgi:hypothetical protein